MKLSIAQSSARFGQISLGSNTLTVVFEAVIESDLESGEGLPRVPYSDVGGTIAQPLMERTRRVLEVQSNPRVRLQAYSAGRFLVLVATVAVGFAEDRERLKRIETRHTNTVYTKALVLDWDDLLKETLPVLTEVLERTMVEEEAQWALSEMQEQLRAASRTEIEYDRRLEALNRELLETMGRKAQPDSVWRYRPVEVRSEEGIALARKFLPERLPPVEGEIRFPGNERFKE